MIETRGAVKSRGKATLTASALIRATKPFAREIVWKSWWCLWSTLAILVGLLTLASLDISWWLRVPAGLTAGLTFVRIFIIYHDHQHGTILHRSALADFLMTAFGLLLLAPPSIWRRSHRHHHNHNGRLHAAGIGSFPVMTTRAFARASRWEKIGYIVSRHPLTLVTGYATVFMCNMCLVPFVQRPREHADGAIAIVLHMGLITALAWYAPLLLISTFFLPLCVATALGSYLFYAQHNFPTAHYQEVGPWDYPAAALAGSSYIPMNWVLRWFTGNIGYHHVHHINARIPFYRLPEAMAALTELQSPRVTTLSPRSIYRCLRLKLWDPELQRLVDFAGS